jgi:autophagy-related protein 27
MQLPRLRTADAAILLSLLSLSLPALGVKLDCKSIPVGKQKVDLSALKGPHSVVTSIQEDPGTFNTTYTLDICEDLVKKGPSCPDKTRGKRSAARATD